MNTPQDRERRIRQLDVELKLRYTMFIPQGSSYMSVQEIKQKYSGVPSESQLQTWQRELKACDALDFESTTVRDFVLVDVPSAILSMATERAELSMGKKFIRAFAGIQKPFKEAGITLPIPEEFDNLPHPSQSELDEFIRQIASSAGDTEDLPLEPSEWKVKSIEWEPTHKGIFERVWSSLFSASD